MTRRRHLRPSRAALCTGGLVLAMTCAPRIADATGWALDRYEPSPAGDLFFAADFPWYNRTRLFSLALVGDYAREPLVLRRTGQEPRDLVENMLVLHALGTVALGNRVGLSFALPISLLQDGEPRDPMVPNVGAYDNPVSGDIRVGARVRLLGDADRDAWSLHAGGHLHLGFIPYNDADHNVTDGQLRGRFYVTLAGHPGILRYSATLGYHARPRTLIGTTAIDDDIYGNFALGLTAGNGRLTVGPEGWISVIPNGPEGRAFSGNQISAEALLGIHYLVADTILVGMGAGPGITQGPGTPQIRGLLRVAYAPERREVPRPLPPPDTDGDGVLDPDDLCVAEPMGTHPDPARRGCPLRDTDQDTVFDDEDQCVSEPQGDHPDPARPGCPLRDTDNDTVFDNEDQCPTTSRGETPDPDRPGCPDVDDDNDGVLNHADQCRTQHQGPHPDPARPGCPLPDRDNDGVPDATDHCPDQPGAPHPDPNRNGCPGLVRVEAGQIRILQPVFFATNRDRILPRSFRVLQAVADALRASPEIRRVSIEGHTDDVGNDAANMDLSQRRANSVMTWLTQHGVEPARLEAHGFGETRPTVPITPGMSRREQNAARAQNRRVEFRIVEPAQPGATTPAPAATPTTGGSSPAPAP